MMEARKAKVDRANLLAARSIILADNLKRALLVAGDNKVGEADQPAKITQADLAEDCQSSRTTISLLSMGKTDDKQANPDLETLSAVAEALGTSPAFLLMGAAEWRAILAAVQAIASAKSAPNIAGTVGNTQSCALTGLEYAKELDVFAIAHADGGGKKPPSAKIEELIKEAQRKEIKSIFVGSAMAAGWATTDDQRHNLTCIGAVLGSAITKE